MSCQQVGSVSQPGSWAVASKVHICIDTPCMRLRQNHSLQNNHKWVNGYKDLQQHNPWGQTNPQDNKSISNISQFWQIHLLIDLREFLGDTYWTSVLMCGQWLAMRSAIRRDCILRGELKGHWHKFEGLKYPFKRTICFHARRARAYKDGSAKAMSQSLKIFCQKATTRPVSRVGWLPSGCFHCRQPSSAPCLQYQDFLRST